MVQGPEMKRLQIVTSFLPPFEFNPDSPYQNIIERQLLLLIQTIPAKCLRAALNKKGVVMAKILVNGGAGCIGSHVVDLDDLFAGRQSIQESC